MLRTAIRVYVVAAILIIGATGCEKRSGKAVVLTKEHIAAALPIGETPNPQLAPGPDEEVCLVADDKLRVMGTR